MSPSRLSRTRAGLAILAGLALLLSACASGNDEPVAAEPEVQVIGGQAGGDPLPEASFAVLGEPDRQVAMSDLRGKPAIINFWATWCPFCVEEMPDLEVAHQTLGERVTFVGIDRQDNEEQAVALAQETGVTYLLLSSPDGDFYTDVNGRGMPTTLFVDAEGVIQHRHAGPITAEQLLELVEEKLGVSS